MIDVVTGWFEVVRCDDKGLITIANLVENMWLSRYHRPIKITYDQEFFLLVMISENP